MLFLLLVLKDFFNTIGFTCYFDDVLIEELEAFGGVLITVPKWCGKTTSDSQLAHYLCMMKIVEKVIFIWQNQNHLSY